MYDVTIKGACNGWIVQVGCQVFVADNLDHMLGEIKRYILNPQEVAREYLSAAKNRNDHGGNRLANPPIREIPRNDTGSSAGAGGTGGDVGDSP